jgi:hypothetical protein
MKMGYLWSEASAGVLQNFRRDSEYSTTLEIVDCETEFTGLQLGEDRGHSDFLRVWIKECVKLVPNTQ